MNESLNPKNSATNIRARINVLKDDIGRYIKKQAQEKSDDVKKAIQSEIDKSNQEITQLSEELEDIESQVKGAAKDSLMNLINDNHIAYIASDGKYVLITDYSKDPRRVNLKEETVTYQHLKGMLNNMARSPGKFSNFTEDDLRTVFEKAGKSYQIKTSSFHASKWNEEFVFNSLKVQSEFWAPITTDINYNDLFDDLFYCLCGGKQENIEHLEKWIVMKRLHPEKCHTIPHLNITGKPGGNGKGIFMAYLASLFTPNSVYKGDIKELSGGFNSAWEGRIIINLDDEEEKQFPHASMKKSTGSNEIRIEPKGVNAYTVDATFSLIVTDNTGIVKLVGGGIGGEDRRWSIIATELVLLDYLSKKYNITLHETKTLVEYFVTEYVENRLEIAKHFSHLVQKHDGHNMTTLLALHGDDYDKRIEEQKDQYQEVFEQVLPIFLDQGIIPYDFLKQIAEVMLDIKIKGNKFSEKFDDFLSRKGIKNVQNADARTKITWQGSFTGDLLKKKVRRLSDQYQEFDYSLISSVAYDKNKTLTKETLNLRDFDNEEKSDPIIIPKETNLVPAETLLEKLKKLKDAN
jgi:uncharacterized protein YukE